MANNNWFGEAINQQPSAEDWFGQAQGAAPQQAQRAFSAEGPQLYDEAYARNKQYAKDGPYKTPLDWSEEGRFRQWVKSKEVPFDPVAEKQDYDMRGFWKNDPGSAAKWEKGSHFPDTYKTPYDTTFSGESIYAKPNAPLKWQGDKLVNTDTGEAQFDSDQPNADVPVPKPKGTWDRLTSTMRDPKGEPYGLAETQLEGEEAAHPIWNAPSEIGGEATTKALTPALGEEGGRLAGAAVSGALTPLPGVGTAGRVAYGVGATAASDIAGHFTDNPVIKLGAALGISLMAGKLLDHAYGSELGELAQGKAPKVGPEASLEAQEAANIPGTTVEVDGEKVKPKTQAQPPAPEEDFHVGTGDLVDKHGNVVGHAPEKPAEGVPAQAAAPSGAEPPARSVKPEVAGHEIEGKGEEDPITEGKLQAIIDDPVRGKKDVRAAKRLLKALKESKTRKPVETHLAYDKLEAPEALKEEPPAPAQEAKPEEANQPHVDAATADLLRTQATNPQGEVKYLKVSDLRKNPDMLKVSPEEYQFKQGVDKSGITDAERIDQYNESYAPPLKVHHRPDGDFVVDGHHRLESALRSAPDDAVIPYQVLNGTDAEVPGAIKWKDAKGNEKTTGVTVADARAYGAELNIANQRGTSYDMAKWMRDTGSSPEELQRLGLSMTEAKTNDAAGLSRLSPFLWDEYRRGNLTPGRAVEIGNGFAGDSHGQEDLYKQIAGDKTLSTQDVQNLIRLRKNSAPVEAIGGQGTLGGGEGGWLQNTTFAQQAKILSKVQEGLESDARKMGGTAKAKEMLEAAGDTKIDRDALANQAHQARQVGELLPKFIYQDGSMSNLALRKLGYELAEAPKNRTDIYARARQEIMDAVKVDAGNAGLKIDEAVKGPEALDPQKSMFGGGTTLAAGVPPQAVQKAQAMAKWVSNKLDSSRPMSWLKTVFAPETMGLTAQRTTSKLEEQAADLRAHVGSMDHVAAPLRDWFENLPENERFQAYGAMQHGDLSMLPDELRPIAQAAYEGFDQTHGIINDMKGGEFGYRQNYLPQMWASRPEEVDEVYNRLKNAGAKSLQGEKGFLKARKYDDISAGIESGLTPKFKNPIDMLLKGYENQWRYVTGQRLFDALKDMPGGAVFLREGERLPEGMAYIDDKIAKARSYSPEAKGMVARGSWIMPEAGARIVNNYTAPGFKPGWWRSLSSWGNMMRVELSGFHTMLTSNSNADLEGGGALAFGLGKLANGEVMEGLKDLAKVPKTWLTAPDAIKQIRRGNELIREALNGNLEDPVVKDVITSGGSFDFGDSVTGKMLVDSITDKMGLPGKVVKNMLGFTMKKVVAPMKVAAFERMYARELEQAYTANGGEDLTMVQRRNIAQGVRRHIDNVMGQIARDNLHSSNKIKDGVASIIAFPGWNIGSIRLFGGIGRGLYQMGTGQELDMQARLALQYAAGKALRSGVQGMLINKVLTGEWPKSVYEMYTWPTGKKDSNGNQIRMIPAEYLTRDILSLFGHERKQDPNDVAKWPKSLLEMTASKLNWPLTAGYEIIKNADYFGKPITFPHTESMPRQTLDIMEHIAKAGGVPFSLTNIAEQRSQAGEESGPLGIAKGLMTNPLGTAKEIGIGAAGLTPANRSLRQTPMQNYVDNIEQQQVRQTAQSPQDVQHEEARRELRTTLRAHRSGEDKTPIDFSKYVKQGMSPQDIKEVLDQSKMKPLEAALHRIPLEELGRSWQIAHDSGDEQDENLVKRVAIKRFQSQTDPAKKKAMVPDIRKMLVPEKKKEEARPEA